MTSLVQTPVDPYHEYKLVVQKRRTDEGKRYYHTLYSRKYYHKNKEVEKQKSLERYYRTKAVREDRLKQEVHICIISDDESDDTSLVPPPSLPQSQLQTCPIIIIED